MGTWVNYEQSVGDFGTVFPALPDPMSEGPWRYNQFLYSLFFSNLGGKFRMVKTANGTSWTELDAANAPTWVPNTPIWSADFGVDENGDPIVYLVFPKGTLVEIETDMFITQDYGTDHAVTFLRRTGPGNTGPLAHPTGMPVQLWRFDFTTDTWHQITDSGGPVLGNFDHAGDRVPVGGVNWTNPVPALSEVMGLLVRNNRDTGAAVVYYGDIPTIDTFINTGPTSGGPYAFDFLVQLCGKRTFTPGGGWSSFTNVVAPASQGELRFWVQAYNDFGDDYGVITHIGTLLTETSLDGDPLGLRNTTLTFAALGFTPGSAITPYTYNGPTGFPPYADNWAVTVQSPTNPVGVSAPYPFPYQRPYGFFSRFMPRQRTTGGAFKLFFAYINQNRQIVVLDAYHSGSGRELSYEVGIRHDVGGVGFGYGSMLQFFAYQGQTALMWFGRYVPLTTVWRTDWDPAYYGGVSIDHSSNAADGIDYNPNLFILSIEDADTSFSDGSLGPLLTMDMSTTFTPGGTYPNYLGPFSSPWDCRPSAVVYDASNLDILKQPPPPLPPTPIVTVGRVSIAY